MTDNTTTRHAAELLSLSVERLGTDLHGWLDLLTEDAVVEFPYAESLGHTGRLIGKPAIAEYFARALQAFSGLTFRELRMYPGRDPSIAVAEVHGSAIITPTGKRYEQDYVMLVHSRDGRIALYREYWNPLPVLESFGGAAELAALRQSS